MSSLTINLEIGHDSSLRAKTTPEGFTHDWEVFVKGCNGADISYYVEKVVFILHETFAKPKRVVKEPPFSVRTSGYAGFILPIEIYLKNNQEPKKIQFNYDLYLQPSGPPLHKVQKEKYTFHSVSEDFQNKLLKGGAVVGSGNSLENNSKLEEKSQMSNKPKIGGSDQLKKYKLKPDEPRSAQFTNLFGPPITKTTRAVEVPKIKEPSKPVIKPSDKDKGKISDKDKNKNKNNYKEKEKDKEKEKLKEKQTESSGDKKLKEEKKDKRDKKDRESTKSDKKERKDKDKDREKHSPSRIRSPTPKKSPKRPRSPSPVKNNAKDKEQPKESRERDREKERKLKKHKEKDNKYRDREKDKERSSEYKNKDIKNAKERDKDTSSNSITGSVKEREQDASSMINISGPKLDKKDKIKEKDIKEPEKVDKEREKSEEKPKHKHKKRDKDRKEKKEEKSHRKEKDEKKPDKDRLSSGSSKDPLKERDKTNNLFGHSPKSDGPASPLSPEKLAPTQIDDDSSSISKSSRESTPVHVPPPLPPQKASTPVHEPKKVLVDDSPIKRELPEDGMTPTPSKKKDKKEKKKDKKGEKEHDRKRKKKVEAETQVDIEEPPLKVEKKEEDTNNNSDDERKVSSSEDANPIPYDDDGEAYMTMLRELQHKIMGLKDNSDLRKVVQLIAETGRYEVSAHTFDFDLCLLDRSTVMQLQSFFSSVN